MDIEIIEKRIFGKIRTRMLVAKIGAAAFLAGAVFFIVEPVFFLPPGEEAVFCFLLGFIFLILSHQYMYRLGRLQESLVLYTKLEKIMEYQACPDASAKAEVKAEAEDCRQLNFSTDSP